MISDESLQQFLAKLPDWWQQDMLSWLQEAPDAKGIALLNRLKSAHPDRFSDTHARCNAECSSGAASWPRNWPTPRR